MSEEPLFFLDEYFVYIFDGFCCIWYKKCHNLPQIIGGIIYGSITGYLYYTYIAKYLIK